MVPRYLYHLTEPFNVDKIMREVLFREMVLTAYQ